MAEYNTKQFEKDGKALGVTISDEQIRQFLQFHSPPQRNQKQRQPETERVKSQRGRRKFLNGCHFQQNHVNSITEGGEQRKYQTGQVNLSCRITQRKHCYSRNGRAHSKQRRPALPHVKAEKHNQADHYRIDK